MKILTITAAAVLMGTAAYAQSAIDAYRISQPDMKGTARFMSMGGAFGALGGDLSCLSQNPAGIGVYRSSDIGFTLDLDLQNSSTSSPGYSMTDNQTKFLLNNIGLVWTLKLNSESCPNINIGFTYNKAASFNRRYRGNIGLTNSLSNYIAAITTEGGYHEGQLIGDEYNDFDPYNPPITDAPSPWISILGYQNYLFALQQQSLSPGTPYYVGQWNNSGDPNTRTYGTGFFNVQESGGVDSYNIALGGNISNVVYWGMDFDITHINYRLGTYWEENLTNAWVEEGDVNNSYLTPIPAQWGLNNMYKCTGTGFNYKLGIIIKPIQELRLGFAFQTPTWYTLNETFSAQINPLILNGNYFDPYEEAAYTNYGTPGYNDIDFRTPWKITASAALVLFNKLIVSADYEWSQYKKMKYSYPSYGGDYWWNNGFGDGWGWDWYTAQGLNYIEDPIDKTNREIGEYYRNTNTLRLGAEFRVTPQFSVRAGYAFVSSPVENDLDSKEIATAGTIPNYRFDNTTNYLSCGLGYKVKNFYVDLAYVYKHMTSTYHAFSNWYRPTAWQQDAVMTNYEASILTQKSSVSLNNNQIVLTAGFRF